jgi:hypothetical protein
MMNNNLLEDEEDEDEKDTIIGIMVLKVEGFNRHFQLRNSSTTIRELKDLIHEEVGTPLEELSFLWEGGRELADMDKSLAKYGIENGKMIRVLRRNRELKLFVATTSGQSEVNWCIPEKGPNEILREIKQNIIREDAIHSIGTKDLDLHQVDLVTTVPYLGRVQKEFDRLQVQKMPYIIFSLEHVPYQYPIFHFTIISNNLQRKRDAEHLNQLWNEIEMEIIKNRKRRYSHQLPEEIWHQIKDYVATKVETKMEIHFSRSYPFAPYEVIVTKGFAFGLKILYGFPFFDPYNWTAGLSVNDLIDHIDWVLTRE